MLLFFFLLLQGHNRKDMFIATQMPLPTTVGDLWRMMYDYNSFTIVMLNPFDNTDKVGGTTTVS